MRTRRTKQRSFLVLLHRLAAGAVGIATVSILGACGDDNPSPSGPSVTIGAPAIVSPEAGSEITDDQPTLVVSNVTVSDGGTPTYSFQVAKDSSFSDIVAEIDGVGQGDGETSWMVTPPLGNGDHFWRARARVSNTDGPFSSVADFTLRTAFKSSEPRDGVLVFDPLTNGGTVGVAIGGEFTDEGWAINAKSNRLIYDFPEAIPAGFVEARIKGLMIRNIGSGSRMLLVMWDPSISSDFTRNRFRVNIQKHDRGSTSTMRYLRIRWISQGRRIDEFSGFLGWKPDRAHRIRLQWGPEGPERRLFTRLFIDGTQRIFFEYRQPYTPNLHRIELGAGMRAETPEGAIYSDVRIGVRE